MKKTLKFPRIELSYLDKAPDHGQPELAVVFPQRKRNRIVPIAVGEQATQLWKHPLSEEEFLALVDHATEEKLVSA
ncbi:MAG: hypothetical protein KatS3mg071_1711 [Meiothermus sp.]|nr:MAG: hypothetical protein KatS3mg071_1711 [Meiothermus sp.]